MAGFGADAVRRAALRAAAAMPDLKDRLNEADSRLGDGDTGNMLARVLQAIADKAAVDTETDAGALFTTLARTAASGTGSSLGTLLATALLALGKATKGQTEIPFSALADLVEGAQAAMMARGGATLGDKTVLDGLDAVATAVRGLEDGQEVAARAASAAREALDSFRDRPNRIGRARMFAEASVGLDDPGMLAFAELVRAVGGLQAESS